MALDRFTRELLNTLLIVLGILSAGMGLYGFLLSSNFIDGGVTGVSMLLYRGYGGMSGEEQDILYCVVTRLEIGRVKGIVGRLDDQAFVVTHALADAEGGVVKKTGVHAGKH
jgi:uncharacterized membrane-anchored protein YitT (DUF2179 family)